MQYRRIILTGASYFFTINLAERKSTLLIDKIDCLKAAFNHIQLRHPFKIDVIIFLPDHMHVMMTLPEDDANYSLRWNLIKDFFLDKLRCAKGYLFPKEKTRTRYLAKTILGASHTK